MNSKIQLQQPLSFKATGPSKLGPGKETLNSTPKENLNAKPVLSSTNKSNDSDETKLREIQQLMELDIKLDEKSKEYDKYSDYLAQKEEELNAIEQKINQMESELNQTNQEKIENEKKMVDEKEMEINQMQLFLYQFQRGKIETDKDVLSFTEIMSELNEIENTIKSRTASYEQIYRLYQLISEIDNKP